MRSPKACPWKVLDSPTICEGTHQLGVKKDAKDLNWGKLRSRNSVSCAVGRDVKKGQQRSRKARKEACRGF